MKNSTIKNYADKVKGAKIVNFKLHENAPSTYDHMGGILRAKGVKKGEIFLIDKDEEALIGLIKLVKNLESESVKVGVLFRIDGHTTPFCISKTVGDDGSDKTTVYHTDSVVMDSDNGGDQTRELVRKISKIAPIYSLGFDKSNELVSRDFLRQTDEGSCATYSLFDVDTMVRDENFDAFVQQHSKPTPERNIFNLEALPPVFMSTIQSITGRSDAGMVIRNGLKYFVETNQIPAEQQIVINDEATTLVNILKEVEEENIHNPVIDIMNGINLSFYADYKSKYSPRDSEIYNLDSKTLKAQEISLSDAIFDLASDRASNKERENDSETEVSDNETETSDNETEISDDDLPTAAAGVPKRTEDKKSDSTDWIAAAITIGVITGLVIIKVLQDRNKEASQAKQETQSAAAAPKPPRRRIIYSDDEPEPNIPSISPNTSSCSPLEKVNHTEISDEEMAESAFGQGSNTARLLRERAAQIQNSSQH